MFAVTAIVLWPSGADELEFSAGDKRCKRMPQVVETNPWQFIATN